MIKGSRRVLYDQIVTRDSTFKMNILLNWGKEYEEAMVVATTLAKPIAIAFAYILCVFEGGKKKNPVMSSTHQKAKSAW